MSVSGECNAESSFGKDTATTSDCWHIQCLFSEKKVKFLWNNSQWNWTGPSPGSTDKPQPKLTASRLRRYQSKDWYQWQVETSQLRQATSNSSKDWICVRQLGMNTQIPFSELISFICATSANVGVKRGTRVVTLMWRPRPQRPTWLQDTP